MKKILLVIAITVLAIASLSLAGYAYAQTQTPPNPNDPANSSLPGWRSFGGMMGGRWNRNAWRSSSSEDYGPIHEYMIAALARAFNLTPEELEARHDAGETMWDIAADLGLDAEQFRQAMLDARTQALNDAVAAGVITQEQADWMVSRMNQMWSRGFGSEAGGCPGMGGSFQGRMGGGRWNR